MSPTLRNLCLAALVGLTSAIVCEKDPSAYQDLAADAKDNKILADYKDAPFASNLAHSLESAYKYTGTKASKEVRLSHATYSVDKNDTSVIVISDGIKVHGSYLNVIKEGYSSDLIQASFFGVNAAINVQNGSVAYFDHLNITTHNGAANVFAYGTGSVVHISDSTLYSSGPVAHGLYASGNGTIYGSNIAVYTGGNRCSAFSGDSPAGYIHVTNAIAHTVGIGSAIFYALGENFANNVIGLAENSPAMFMDGIQSSTFKNVDFTAGLLAGFILFSSRDITTGGKISLTDSRVTTLGADMPAFWFGNTVASATIRSTEVNTASGILVVANYSQVTQDFDYFAGYPDNPNLSPAHATVSVAESHLTGDLVAYNSSSIAWTLSSHSSWTGTAYTGYGKGYFAVYIDSSSTWSLTKDITLQNFTDGDKKFSNIKSNGFNIHYDKSSKVNTWLKGKTYSLPGGGKVVPSSYSSY